MSTNNLKIGFPSGSLQEATFKLFGRAGYRINLPSRSYEPEIDDPELSGLMFRAQEIAHYVERGVLDVGVTGKDWVEEWQADVIEIGELRYSKATSRPLRWVIAVPEDSPIKTLKDLQGKTIASELVGVTRRYLEERDIQAEVDFSWGTT
ncbi:MAG: ATP phosphoribosyltransferase, partial [Gemmatimonadetes bacterium]|nr:ATP phosphoribosyltransferase [Gemmatimonadota bacterium]